jgi:hypothetical protein
MPVTDIALIDNDVAIKVCAYRCHNEAIALTTFADGPPAILAVATYSIRSRLERRHSLQDPAGALAAFDELVSQLSIIDPSESEVALAAEFEEHAKRLGFDLDVGESLLLAILLERNCCCLVTGDKRAIAAMAAFEAAHIGQRVMCLEMLMACLVGRYPFDEIRTRICSEPNADRTMTICFGCRTQEVTLENVLDGLFSYYSSIVETAENVLLEFGAI